MRAIMWTAYGGPDVLQLQEIAKPAPKDNEVLIKIRATTVTSGDCEMRNLTGALWYTLPMRAYVGLARPSRITILGMELAGDVEAVGKDVTRVKAGAAVFAATGFISMGSCAEYICLPEDPEDGALVAKPANMSYEEATTVPVGGLEALHFLRQAQIQPGDRVLINGASGTIGSFAVQLAKHFGAEVTGVDSTAKLDLLRSLGADHVVDYTQEDFSTRGETYDLILDVVGRGILARCVRALKPNGRYLIANPRLSQRLQGGWMPKADGKQVLFGAVSPTTDDLIFLKELAEAGVLKSIIDRRFPLEQTAEAHRYVESGQRQGHVVITVA